MARVPADDVRWVELPLGREGRRPAQMKVPPVERVGPRTPLPSSGRIRQDVRSLRAFGFDQRSGAGNADVLLLGHGINLRAAGRFLASLGLRRRRVAWHTDILLLGRGVDL